MVSERLALSRTIQFQKALCDSLGIRIKPVTNSDKVFGFLKKVGDTSIKRAAEMTDALKAPSPPRKRSGRRKKKQKLRSPEPDLWGLS